jgi:hypothetical protein
MKNVIKMIWLWITDLFTTVAEKEPIKIQPVKTVKEVEIFRSNLILNARPENMSFPEFRKHLKRQKWIKTRKRGFWVYETWDVQKRKNVSFIGLVNQLQPM